MEGLIIYSIRSFGLLNIARLNFIMISYEIGTTNSVNNVEEINPPITVIANAFEIRTELPPPNNSGTNAPIVAIAVIKIGLKRVLLLLLMLLL